MGYYFKHIKLVIEIAMMCKFIVLCIVWDTVG